MTSMGGGGVAGLLTLIAVAIFCEERWVRILCGGLASVYCLFCVGFVLFGEMLPGFLILPVGAAAFAVYASEVRRTAQ